MNHLRSGITLTLAVTAMVITSCVAGPGGAQPLPGANQWDSCRPKAEHPRPVVLVHGNGSGMTETWSTLAPRLERAGFCVFGLEYGRYQPGSGHNLLDIPGGTDIESSSRVLATFVARVQQSTGADQVDIIGHSMGALAARQYLKFDGGSDPHNPTMNVVHTLVSLGGTNHGSTFGPNLRARDDVQAAGLPADEVIAMTVGPAYTQQLVGSTFLRNLNAGGDTRPGVRYVAIASHDDGVVHPPDSAFLTAGDGADVDNIWVQDGCGGLSVDHVALTTEPRSLWHVVVGLDPGYATNHPAPCI